VAATIVDWILLLIVSAIILAVTGTSRRGGYPFLSPVLQGVYLILMIGGHGGRTVGNMVASTVTIDGRTGATAGYDRAVPRALVQIVLDITVIGGILDVLWPLWDRQNQTLHDKAAGTVVLRTDAYR
jgi:uncharacterized RDD family membrane protein YckC